MNVILHHLDLKTILKVYRKFVALLGEVCLDFLDDLGDRFVEISSVIGCVIPSRLASSLS
jgi:hypothetical protein